ncbi:MAG: hypothetical protein JJU32_05305 [Phormidium sp. BM_Day4_Bin.17]|nr:hypothetical protein [Phormidium sp. BM_Day4_Bin.17]UCJ12758.1 MAG: hypothetical protein JWS08_02805 [Phormidium sp. PBR-2020]
MLDFWFFHLLDPFQIPSKNINTVDAISTIGALRKLAAIARQGQGGGQASMTAHVEAN